MMLTNWRVRTAAIFALAGVALTTYPIVRPYPPTGRTDGAAELASGWWTASHALGVAGFVLLAFGLRAAADRAPWPWRGRPVRAAESRAWLAVALLLPYYGAESLGLHALGSYVVTTGDAHALDVVEGFRYATVPLVGFGLGLLALALVGGRLMIGLWSAGRLGRLGGLLAGLGLLTYLPQFYLPAPGRMLHGLVLGVGLALIGAAALRAPERPPAPATPAPSADARR